MTATAPLPVEVRRLVQLLAAGLPAEGELLDAQAASAVVTSSSPTMVDVDVPPGGERMSLPDGPLPLRAIVHDEAGDPVGELLVWIRAGRLVGVEQAWYTDDPPDEWPSPDHVRLSR